MTQFYSLDGNFYSFVNTPLELIILVDAMTKYESGSYKIFSSTLDLNQVVQSELSTRNTLQLVPYDTNFYQILPSDIASIKTRLQDIYGPLSEFEYQRITLASDQDNIDRLLDISLHVSAYKQINGAWVGDNTRINNCQKHFNQALEQSNLSAYLVGNKAGQLAGGFCLVETDLDIQLESVSGKSQKYKMLQGYKFPYLLMAILEIYGSQFSHKPLRFSSSKEKVIELYDRAGCPRTNTLRAAKVEVKQH